MIGCYLVKDLIAKGCTVVGVDRRVSDWTHEHLKQVVLGGVIGCGEGG